MRLQTKQGLAVFLLFLCGSFGGSISAQTIVAAPPLFWQQYFKSSGVPNAFGCIFTYVSGSTTPLATYTDFTGATQNSNPIILDAGGFAGTSGNGMFLQAGTAYRIVEKTSGGTHCASGSTVRSIDGIGGGTTVNTTVVTYGPTPSFPIVAQNELFKITLTGNAVAQPLTAVGILPPALVAFEITQDGAGGHTFTWPSNSVGGSAIGLGANQVSTQTFYWDGTTAQPIGPLLAGQVPAVSRDLLNWLGDINVADDATILGIVTGGTYRTGCTPRSTTGTFQLCKTDNILWRDTTNLINEGIQVDGGDRLQVSTTGGLLTSGATPDLFLGGTSASFPRLKRNAAAINFRLADDSADAAITASTAQFSGVITSTSATYGLLLLEVSDPGAAAASNQRVYAKAGKGLCSEDSSSNVYCGVKGGGIKVLSAPGTYSCTGDQTVCSFTLTWPTAWPDTNYTAVCNPGTPSTTTGDQSLANGGQGNLTTTTIDVYSMSNGTTTKTYSNWTCYGIHN